MNILHVYALPAVHCVYNGINFDSWDAPVQALPILLNIKTPE